MGRQTLRSHESRSDKALKVTRQNPKVQSKLKVTNGSRVKVQISPKSAKERGRGTKAIDSEVKSSDTLSLTLNGSVRAKRSDKRKPSKAVKQSNRKAVNNKTNVVRNRKSATKSKNEGSVIEEKFNQEKSKSTKPCSHKQNQMAKNSKSEIRKTTDSRLTGRSKTNRNASPKRTPRSKSENSESTNRPKRKEKSDKHVKKSKVDKKSSTRSRLGKTATEEASETASDRVKHKSEVGGRKRPAPKPTTKAKAKERLIVRQANGKKSTDKGKSEGSIVISTTDKTETKSDEEETMNRSPPKRKSKTDGLEVMENAFNKKPAVKVKSKSESAKTPKRKQNAKGIDASTDSPAKLDVVKGDRQLFDLSPEPSPKRRKTSSSVDGKKKVPEKVKDSSSEDPYDFEAYLSTITPGKRKKALGKKKEEKLTGAEKPKVAPQKRVWGRQAPQRTPWGGIARKGGTTPAHKFFIQPSRPKKKPQQSDHVEEPSPSIAEEIVEFTLQPPFVPADDEEEPGRPLGVPTSSMIISTPRTGLTAAPLLRPMGATIISPISAATEDSTRASTAPQVKSLTTEQLEPAALKLSNPENPSHSVSARAENEKEHGKKTQKVAQQMKEKDEFEAWLEKFSRELSDIETFELSIERS